MEGGKLTNLQIVNLARCISTQAMESIALWISGLGKCESEKSEI